MPVIEEVVALGTGAQVIIITEHEDDSYNGEYVTGNDCYVSINFVMGDRHLFYLPYEWSQGSWWQLDDMDQEEV